MFEALTAEDMSELSPEISAWKKSFDELSTPARADGEVPLSLQRFQQTGNSADLKGRERKHVDLCRRIISHVFPLLKLQLHHPSLQAIDIIIFFAESCKRWSPHSIR